MVPVISCDFSRMSQTVLSPAYSCYSPWAADFLIFISGKPEIQSPVRNVLSVGNKFKNFKTSYGSGPQIASLWPLFPAFCVLNQFFWLIQHAVLGLVKDDKGSLVFTNANVCEHIFKCIDVSHI